MAGPFPTATVAGMSAARRSAGPAARCGAAKDQNHVADPYFGARLVDRPDLDVDQVGIAEIGDECAGRRLVEIARTARLGDAGIGHDDDVVGNRQRFALVGVDIGDRQIEPLLQLADIVTDAAAQLGVEIRKRLVEQQYLRLEHQRAGDRDALLLTARQLGVQPPIEALETDDPSFASAISRASAFLIPLTVGP